MTAATLRPSATPGSPWTQVARAAAALAAAMGVGRFVYTPILPLMHAQAGLSSAAGANLATANYVGYLIGALIGTLAPRLMRSVPFLRGSLVVLTATLAVMPLTHSVVLWAVLRLIAGILSATIFVTSVNSLFSHLHQHPAHLTGWALGGVGGGIALSGLLVLLLRSVGDWRTAWWAAAGLSALFCVVAWNLRPATAPETAPTVGVTAAAPRTNRLFGVLFVSYLLEGVGYIIAGTFLVAAIDQTSPGSLGSVSWVLVGLAAVPSAALWAGLGKRFTRPTLLTAALTVQAVGIALPALVDGIAPALVSAILFGATFLGVATISLAIGSHLAFPRAVALLTAGYSVGQILGPLAVTPLIHHGYHQALLLAALVVLAAAVAAGLLRLGFPHRMPDGTPVARPNPDEDDTAEASGGTLS